MAQTVTVHHNDTINKILKTRKGLKDHQIHTWLKKLARINPHISDLNRIHSGDTILIPETLDENVPEAEIWKNAFRKIPRTINTNNKSTSSVYMAQPGETIDQVVAYMFSNGRYFNMTASTKRALLIHNNPFLKAYLNIPFTKKMLLDISPVKLSTMEKSHWKSEQYSLNISLDGMDKQLHDMFKQTGAEPAFSMAQVVENLKNCGASVGASDVINATGYGIAGLSGHAEAGAMAVGNINALNRELYTEAVEKLGKKVVHSKKASHMAKMQQFLKNHPKYAQLTRHLKDLPKHLLSKTDISPVLDNAHTNFARQFRKHVSLPLKKWHNPTRYVNSMTKQLNGRLSLFQSIGRHATWYVPAVLGVASVATAPAGQQMRTLFQEGFGILGGAIGTKVGTGVGGFIAISVLGLGPFGLFVAVFVCASAGGILGMELFKGGAGKFYDLKSHLGNGQIYYEPEQLLLETVK